VNPRCKFVDPDSYRRRPEGNLTLKITMKKQKILLVVPAICLIAFGCSKSSTEGSGNESRNAEPAVQPTQNLNVQAEQASVPIEMQIHDYTQQVGEEYTASYGVEKGEALAAIAASKKFKMSILDVSRVHDQIENKKAGWNFSSAELDQMNLKRFKDIGFVEKDGIWYYEGQAVDMGKPSSK
jgi:hypothetical protein